MNQQWIFGIDGGGTSTRLRVEGLARELLYQAEDRASTHLGRLEWFRKTLEALFRDG